MADQSLQLSATLELDVVIAATARSLRESGGFTDCDVFMIEGSELVCAASLVEGDEYPEWIGKRLPLDEWRMVWQAVRLSRAEVDAITDGLTGLYNHRYLHERLAEELDRALREGLSASLLCCDLDFFKDYNERHGHAAGDDALRSTARILEKCRRRADLIARYGGEEFMVVLLEAADRAKSMAKRLGRDRVVAAGSVGA